MADDVSKDADESKNEEEDKSVPLAALQAETKKRQALAVELAEVKGQVAGLSKGTETIKEPSKELSRSQLRTAVEEEKISQDEADAIWERQTEDRLTKKLEAKLSHTLDSQSLSTKVGNEIDRYKKVVTDLADRESASFQKVELEFKALVGLGYDASDVRTEVAALRSAFGSVDALETAAKPQDRQGHVETGGAGTGVTKTNVDGWPGDMTERQRGYYQHLVDQGMYADKKAAAKAWSYKPKHKPKAA